MRKEKTYTHPPLYPRPKRLSNAARGQELVNDIRGYLTGTSQVLIWRNNTGMLPAANGRMVQFGLALGSSDLIGILSPSGRFLALEIKLRGASDLSPHQRTFINVVNGFGGAAACVSSIKEAQAFIDKARTGQMFKTVTGWEE